MKNSQKKRVIILFTRGTTRILECAINAMLHFRTAERIIIPLIGQTCPKCKRTNEQLDNHRERIV